MRKKDVQRRAGVGRKGQGETIRTGRLGGECPTGRHTAAVKKEEYRSMGKGGKISVKALIPEVGVPIVFVQ